jgi:hypothetical protein
MTGADSWPPPSGVTDPRADAVLLSSAGSAVVRSDATVAVDGSWRSQLVVPTGAPPGIRSSPRAWTRLQERRPRSIDPRRGR